MRNLSIGTVQTVKVKKGVFASFVNIINTSCLEGVLCISFFLILKYNKDMRGWSSVAQTG